LALSGDRVRPELKWPADCRTAGEKIDVGSVGSAEQAYVKNSRRRQDGAALQCARQGLGFVPRILASLDRRLARDGVRLVGDAVGTGVAEWLR